MRPMDIDGRVMISQTSIPDQTNVIVRQFVFTHNVVKSGHFIFDWTNAT